MSTLDRVRKTQLRNALVAAFPTPNDFAIFVDDQLGENVHAILPPGGLVQNAFDLIRWTEGRGRLNELIEGARVQNPRSPALLEFLADSGLNAAASVPRASLQTIFGANVALLNITQWRIGLEEREWQVGRVERDGNARGTAFLVGPDLILTNYHVVADVVGSSALHWGVRFDYRAGPDGVAVDAGVLIPFADAWLVDHTPHSPLDIIPLGQRYGQEPESGYLDFALIRLGRRIGDEPRRPKAVEARGWIRVPSHPTEWGHILGIGILQHPFGWPLRLALGFPPDLKHNPARTRVRYPIPTDQGSSGSPVFDTRWNLVALHHSGDPDFAQPNFNEAIPIDLIAARPAVRAALPP